MTSAVEGLVGGNRGLGDGERGIILRPRTVKDETLSTALSSMALAESERSILYLNAVLGHGWGVTKAV